MPQENSLQGGSREDETYDDRMEKIMESTLIIMQGTQLTNQATPLNPNAVDKNPKGQGTPNITWAPFKELFNAKYFTLCKKLEKSQEFMNLKQTEDMSIAQYEDSFTRLIKYIPIYNLDEEAKA